MNTSNLAEPFIENGLNFSEPNGDTVCVHVSGSWTIDCRLPSAEQVLRRLHAQPKLKKVEFDTQDLTGWDSGFLTFLLKIKIDCDRKNIIFDKSTLPEGVQRLLDLATAVPERKGARRESLRQPFLSKVGSGFLSWLRTSGDMLAFIGETFLATLRFLTGKARFRRSDLLEFIQDAGARAFPIVSLISVLVGLILAFVGAVQLKMFGAQIYVANLVGLAMAREMGAMMAAIIMAGRTGAAYAAQLGTMQVNEEIDALQTLGISPMEFLVMPRMFALVLMMPLLCVYADLMGILGGALVGIGMLDITVSQYYQQTKSALDLTQFGIGIFKSVIFGILVALSGCLHGMQSGRSASAVGDAATSAVVTAIIWIIVADALMTVICNAIGI